MNYRRLALRLRSPTFVGDTCKFPLVGFAAQLTLAQATRIKVFFDAMLIPSILKGGNRPVAALQRLTKLTCAIRSNDQSDICQRFGAEYMPPETVQEGGISLESLGNLPLHAVRISPENGTCGLSIYGGEYSTDADFYRNRAKMQYVKFRIDNNERQYHLR